MCNIVGDILKNILLIIPKFFSYEIYIKKELEKLGLNVCMLYENVDYFSITSKISSRLKNSKMSFYDDYFIGNIGDKRFDYLLAIKASHLSEKVIKYIKKNSPSIKMYMYQWDSVKNNENALSISKFFDKISTFDVEDSTRYCWEYRPLFFINSSERTVDRKYDISYICTLHSQRVKIYKELAKIDLQKYMYLYAKFTYYIKEKYFNRNINFDGVSISDVKFRPLSLEESNRILSLTNIVVDYTHPDQTGFTMRTCEALGHKCKLITNNKLVKNADFYNENNVYIYNADDFMIPEQFINKPYIEISQSIYNNYSISRWIRDIIDYE